MSAAVHSPEMSFDDFSQYFDQLGQSYYKESPELDGRVIVFVESKFAELNAMWALGFANNQEKNVMMQTLALTMQARQTTRYGLMTLIWQAEATEGVLPSKSKNRIEGLLVTCSDGKRSSVVLHHVMRVDGKISSYSEVVAGDMVSLTMFSNLLEMPRAPEELQLMADEFLAPALMLGNTVRAGSNSSAPKPN